MHHLRAIRDLSLHYMRWAEVEELIAALAAAAPDMGGPDRDLIAIYAAYHAQRRQDSRGAEAILDSLLAAPDLALGLRAEALITRGLCALGQTRLEGAQADFAAALEVAAAAGDHGLQARALVNQSWLLNELYQFDAALEFSQRSLAHFQRANDRYGGAYALYSIGNNALYLGKWELGRQHLDRAAAIYRSADMVARLAMVDWGRGFLYQMLGEEERSKRAYLRALRTAESAEHGNAVTASDTLSELGLIYQVQGRWPRAEDALRRAMAIAERLGDELSHALLLHRYSQMLGEWRGGVVSLARLAEAIEKLERLRVSTQSEEMKIGLLGTAHQVYESMVLAQIARDDHIAAFAYVEQARARAFLDMLAGRSELQELPIYGRPLGLAEVQARLAPGALLLEFFTVGFLPAEGSFIARIPAANSRLRDRLLVRPRTLLFAITATTAELHEIACDPNALRPPQGDPTPGWHMLTERKLRWLYGALLAPVEHLLAGCQVLHIIPHGPLHYVPFAALITPAGGSLLSPDGPVITYAPSATLLARSLAQTPPAAGDVLALGYDDRGPAALMLAEREAQLVAQRAVGLALTGPTRKSAALMFAEQEARLVARRAVGLALTGPDQKSAALAARSAGLRWLHIAGHAVYRADDPMGSYLRLGDGDDLDARTIMRSLTLSGALVTLNACTSGLSHLASGDELLGLPRAFLYAGARTIICTLHEIDDIAASLRNSFRASLKVRVLEVEH